MTVVRRVWPTSYRGRIAAMIALMLVAVLGAQAIIRGVVDDRVRSASERTLQAQARALAEAVDAVPDAVKGDRAADAARYLPATRITVTWPAPGGFYYNLVRLEDLDITAAARSGGVEVRLQRGSALGGVADWLVVALFLAVLVVAAGVVWGLANAVARRLRRQAADLAASAEAVALGDLNVRADVPADELGRAAAAFNRMTERLAETDARQRRFLADVAHELRTPVTAIDGFAAALTDGAASTPEARQEAVAFIRDEAVRLRELIGDLRELTRLDLGPVPVIERFDLADAARAAVARFAQAALDAGVSLTGPDGMLAVDADLDAVGTILSNLIQNAISATPEGGRIDVGVCREATSATVTVTDTGVGIAPDHLPLVFDRLYRVDAARSRAGGGSGLGLAIVKQLADALGGAVAVQSTLGSGSTFEVRIPVSAAPPSTTGLRSAGREPA